MKGSTASVARGDRRSRNGSSTPQPQRWRSRATETRSVAEDVGEELAAARHLDDALQHFQRRREEQRPSVRAPYSQARAAPPPAARRPP